MEWSIKYFCIRKVIKLCKSGKRLMLLFNCYCVRLHATPWTATRQASPSFTISRSWLKLIAIESVMPSNHFMLCCPFSSCPQYFPHQGSLKMTKVFKRLAKFHVLLQKKWRTLPIQQSLRSSPLGLWASGEGLLWRHLPRDRQAGRPRSPTGWMRCAAQAPQCRPWGGQTGSWFLAGSREGSLRAWWANWGLEGEKPTPFLKKLIDLFFN